MSCDRWRPPNKNEACAPVRCSLVPGGSARRSGGAAPAHRSCGWMRRLYASLLDGIGGPCTPLLRMEDGPACHSWRLEDDPCTPLGGLETWHLRPAMSFTKGMVAHPVTGGDSIGLRRKKRFDPFAVAGTVNMGWKPMKAYFLRLPSFLCNPSFSGFLEVKSLNRKA
jgi:hypothetical protein